MYRFLTKLGTIHSGSHIIFTSMNKLKLLFYVKDIQRAIVLTYKSNDTPEKVELVISKMLESKKIFTFKSNVTDDIIILRSSDIRCVMVTKVIEKETDNGTVSGNSDK